MTAYNRDPYLAIAIQSVIDQSFADWTLTIVDDASTDQSYAIAGAFEAIDRRIHVLRNSVNRGCGASLHRAMQNCTMTHDVEFVGWVDSDDILLPTALEKTIGFMRSKPEVDLVYTHYQPINDVGELLGFETKCNTPYSPEALLDESMVFHFRLMRAEAYLGAGGIDPELSVAIDYDLMLRFSEIYQIDCLPEILYLYRIHGGCLSVAQGAEQRAGAIAAVGRAMFRRYGPPERVGG
jgi:glycosyltransferase involved in cell wall biosynthesis